MPKMGITRENSVKNTINMVILVINHSYSLFSELLKLQHIFFQVLDLRDPVGENYKKNVLDLSTFILN